MIGNAGEIVKWLFAQDRERLFEIKEHKEKRSLSANAYFHKLCQLIAEKNHTSIIEVKNQMISDYGQYHYLENGEIDWSIKSENFNHLRCEDVHYQITDRYIRDKGRKMIVYLVMRGSSTYNTAEMSRLIDGTVSEAKELGIETMTPAELERMLRRWEKKDGI